MKTIRRLALLGLALAAILLAGCFDVEQSMSLEKDLSGTAGFAMTVNFEPMAIMMYRMQREMAGTKGEPTPAELEKAKQDFLASKKTQKSPADDFTAEKAKFEKTLPPGVQLIDGGAEDQGLKMRVHFKFRFDDVAKLAKLQFSSTEQQQAPGPKNPYDEPWNNLKVVDEGKTVLLTSSLVDPLKAQEEQTQKGGGPELTPEMRKQMEEVFQGFRLAFKLDTPMEVVESNATRRQGHTLYWEYDMKTADKMVQGIRVRLRK